LELLKLTGIEKHQKLKKPYKNSILTQIKDLNFSVDSAYHLLVLRVISKIEKKSEILTLKKANKQLFEKFAISSFSCFVLPLTYFRKVV